MHIVLVGDSIFDNAAYVEEGAAVKLLLASVVKDVKVTLLAVDGHVTTDVPAQLSAFPDDATHVFVSCGGNDALRIVGVLEKPVASVGRALEVLTDIKEEFRQKYKYMLKAVSEKHNNIVVCTIYNKVPTIPEKALSALALLNEVILEEAAVRKLPVIDLRVICNEVGDYSTVSPIEPSEQGGEKIVRVINTVLNNHDFNASETRVYA